jgi:N-acetylglutamate synthase-like GNAT family acetyltransferase
MISIRPAGRGDIPALIAIDPISMSDTVRRQSIAHWAAAGQCHVAVRAQKVIGYVALTKHFFHQPYIELLIVAADDRRSGVGIALIEHCKGLVPENEKLWSSTNRSNAAMRALLAKTGFVESGVVENLDEGDPELIFLLKRTPTSEPEAPSPTP